MKHIWIFAIILALSLSACGASKETIESIESNTGRINRMSLNMDVIRDEFEAVNFNVRSIDVKVAKFERKLNEITGNGALAMGSEELSSMQAQLYDLDQRLAEVENSGIFPTAQPQAEQTPEGMPIKLEQAEVTIKVLSATGELQPARLLSGQLEASGYNVKRIDLTQSRFRHNTVFFSEGARGAAEAIAGQMGAGTVVKPLTWNSTFKIIAVTIGR